MPRNVYLPERSRIGQPLGRHVRHDPRSLAYLAPEAPAVSVAWPRHIPILDQNRPPAQYGGRPLGSCTGNAMVGALGTGPLWEALTEPLDAGTLQLDEALACWIYNRAEILDGGPGLPTEDQGSSGLSVCTVAKTLGVIGGYLHATSVAEVHGALQTGPVMLGTYWYTGMDHPTTEGIVTAAGTPRGGHEYLLREYDATRDLWWPDNSWSTGWGFRGRFAFDTPTLQRLLEQSGDATQPLPATAPAPTPAPSTDPDAELVAHATACTRRSRPYKVWKAAKGL